jgi:hypothetical protein
MAAPVMSLAASPASQTGRRNEIGMVEVRLLDSWREADDGEVRIQRGFGDVSSEATVGACYESDFSTHGTFNAKLARGVTSLLSVSAKP